MMKFVVAALLLVAGVANAGEVAFEVCDSAELAHVEKFEVSGCEDGSTLCEFVVGNTYTFALTANIHADHPASNSLPFEVTATVLGLPVTLVKGNACDSTPCPITPGSVVTVTIEEHISEAVPRLENVKVSARVWHETAGSNRDASLCASIQASIVDA